MKRGTWRDDAEPSLRLAMGSFPLALAALVAAAGCEALAPRTVRIDTTVGMYQAAKLSYRIDTGKLSEPVKVANIAGQQVSYQQKPSGPYPGHSIVKLAVEYPHPLGHPGYALAEVVVKAQKPPATTPPPEKPAWRRVTDGVHELLTQNNLPGIKLADGVYEAWSLDIPRTDLDGVIGRLSETGYFHLAGNPAPGVDVSCLINGQSVEKQWGHVPELDALIERVRNEGTLVSYTHPLGDEKSNPATAQPVRFASWPPAGAAPPVGAAGQPANLARGDWVANQAGVPVPQPGSPQGSLPQASSPQGIGPKGAPPTGYAGYPPASPNGYPPMARQPGPAVGQVPRQPAGYLPAGSAQYPGSSQGQNPVQGQSQQGPSQYQLPRPTQNPQGSSPYPPQGERPYQGQGPYQGQVPYPPAAPAAYGPNGQASSPQGSAGSQPTATQQPTGAQQIPPAQQISAAGTAPMTSQVPSSSTGPLAGTSSQTGQGAATSNGTSTTSAKSTTSGSRWSLFGSGNKGWSW